MIDQFTLTLSSSLSLPITTYLYFSTSIFLPLFVHLCPPLSTSLSIYLSLSLSLCLSLFPSVCLSLFSLQILMFIRLPSLHKPLFLAVEVTILLRFNRPRETNLVRLLPERGEKPNRKDLYSIYMFKYKSPPALSWDLHFLLPPMSL